MVKDSSEFNGFYKLLARGLLMTKRYLSECKGCYLSFSTLKYLYKDPARIPV
jgi:hypothetical protein